MKYEVIYLLDGQEKRVEFGKSTDIFIVRESPNSFSLEITPTKEITLLSVSAKMPCVFREDDRLFLNGYQSCTESREYTIHERMRGLGGVFGFIAKRYALEQGGDYAFAEFNSDKGALHGYSYGYVRSGKKFFFIGSIAERTGFTAIYFNTKKDEITFCKDCAGLKIASAYSALKIMYLHGGESKVFNVYFSLLGIVPPRVKPVSGFICRCGDKRSVSEKTILENLNAVKNAEYSFDVFQIDEGYQTKVGDWLSVDKEKFPRSMKFVADRVKDFGMKAGLWMAPFACEFGSETAKNHSDWLLKGADGEKIVGGGNWGGFYVMDFYNDEVREYLRRCFDRIINDWGFGLLRLDLLYAACLKPRENKTRGQIMFDVMDFLRECCEGALIIGGGVPLAAAFGKVDYCGIGCDAGRDYDGRPLMSRFIMERESAKNSMCSAVFRRQLSGRAFLNDADIYMLCDGGKLNNGEKFKLGMVNALFGGAHFTTDNPLDYSDKQKAVFEEMLSAMNQNAEVGIVKRLVTIRFGDKEITFKV